MKILLATFGLATAFSLAPITGWAQDAEPQVQTQAPATDSSVSFQDFYNQLADQGTWINSDKYGYVFQPSENDPNWRPYTYGHWVNTDAGMTWVSDDSFGWATDHYGRWVNLDGTGWVWVPGYTWAPAWVSWRDGGDEVGWAPLPPDSDVGIDYYGNGLDLTAGFFGFHIGNDCDTAYGIGPACYHFCPTAYIGDRDAWRHFRDRRDNFALIAHTRNVTNINFNRHGDGRFGHVHAEGPSVAALNAHAHNRIETARLTPANDRREAGLHGNALAVYAPRVDGSTLRTARPNRVSGTIAQARVNRGTDIHRPLAVNSHVAPGMATASQIQAATVAQRNFNSSEHIATTNTHFSHGLTQPLTSMRTETRTANSGATASHFNPGVVQTQHAAVAPDARFTGEQFHPQTHVATQPARHDSGFAGQSAFTGASNERAVFPAATTPAVHHASAFANSGEAYHPGSVNHTGGQVYHPQANAQVFHPSTPAYHPQASAQVYHPSAQTFHPSAAISHPQPSFHPAAPTPHFSGGGGFHGGGAPAAHVGGGGGGHPGGGGGAAHASVSGGEHRH
jgi:hypothetical protein